MTTDPSVLATLDQLREKRERAFSRLQNIYDNSRTLTIENVHAFRTRIDTLSDIEQKFEELQDKITVYNVKTVVDRDKLEVIKIQQAFDNMVYETRGKFLTLIQAAPPITSSTTVTNASPVTNNLSLPDISIPKFGGRIEEWSNFISLYDSIIHNNTSLSAAEKFAYLRSLLQTDALAVISSFELTPTNYELAVTALRNRYQNKRRLANHYYTQIKNFSPLTSATRNALQDFLNVHSNSVNALKALNLQDLADFLLFELASDNLDPGTRKAFETKQNSNVIPSYQDLIDFVTETCKTFEVLSDGISHKPKLKVITPKPTSSFLTKVKEEPAVENSKIISCPLCRKSHALQRCERFLGQSVSEKYETIKKLRRCFNCLGNHIREQCNSKSTCRICQSSRHHTTLHYDKATSSEANVKGSSAANTLSCQVPSSVTPRCVLLGTIQALIQDIDGNYHPIRAVLDPGSQISAITSRAAQKLGLKRSSTNIDIVGIAHSSTKAKGVVSCTLRSRRSLDKININAFVLSSIANDLPSTSLCSSIREKFKDLYLADENFDQSSKVDFLIGSDVYPRILTPDSPHLLQGNPSAMRTLFGWVLIGITSSDEASSSPVSLFISTPSLDTQLRKFWEQEEVEVPKLKNPDDDLCENHFLNTHFRDESGRYVVSLPFKKDCFSVGSNRNTAMKSFLNIEKRLRKHPEKDAQYQGFLTEYENLGHMNIAPNPASYILPHHCVFKQNSSTTKMRVVFNGSAPDSTGTSLNDRLLSGPKLQRDLPTILTSFRFHEIAICADIRMMYRQILLCPEDRQYQHIFWRSNRNSAVQEYELNTVTYGLTPSAFLAQRVIHQLVSDEGASYPAASHSLMNHTYMDDIVTGASSLSEADDLKEQLIDLLSKSGFELRKWCSNVPATLASLPAQHLEHPIVFSTEDSAFKILGLMWDPEQDVFSYHTQPFQGPFTKRSVLSYISQIFDPLGWLAPIVFFAKYFLQQLWLMKYDWDTAICAPKLTSWKQLVDEIHLIETVKIPRKFPVNFLEVRLVGFCDASEKGFAACIYLCFCCPGGNHSHLLKAKSKVAPLKTISVPRLELSGALLLAKLFVSLQNSLLHLNLNETRLYTDAKIVLSWLQTPPHLLKSFVANRVVKILELTSFDMWRHVPSEENPADCASRGMCPQQFCANPYWLKGPSFMSLPLSEWPRQATECHSLEDLPEKRKINIVLSAQQSEDHFEKTLCRVSSLTKLQRIFAYVKRFIYNCRHSHHRKSDNLSTSELKDGLQTCVYVTQQCYFGPEIVKLQNNQAPSSFLLKLSPFLDNVGLLRVGGRLKHSALPYDAKHPLLLPKKSHLSDLICDYYHLYTLHSGPRTVQALISRTFWIVSLRSLLRHRIYRCLRCYKFKAAPEQPVMADLPACRAQLSRAFLQVGTDFAGPFLVKESHRRKASTTKGYLCLFICMATKAVHLEFVSELSTDAFLSTLDRFVSRRGLPQDIYSDCGKNYVGTANHLKEVYQFLCKHNSDIFTALSHRHVHWHFNPPSAPNFGGIWEAAVKSSKNLMRRTIGDASHTFEEYCTLFARIEAALNSRPLCAISPDPAENIDYLSPGHFLIGAPLLAPPEYKLDEDITFRCRWQRLRQLFQYFWRRWTQEYLHTQTQRLKWARCRAINVKKGDVVFMYGVDTSPLSWPIGRIEELLPGPDGVVRVVKLRTASGHFTRPLNKLVLLPPQ